MRQGSKILWALWVVFLPACADNGTVEAGHAGSDGAPLDAGDLPDSDDRAPDSITAGSAGWGEFIGGSSGVSGNGDGRMDAGQGGSGSVEDAATSPGRPAIVAAGYAGLRVASYDGGRTWVNKRTLSNVAADDADNLRGVTYGAGLFVAVGHKIFTSPDGGAWQQREHPKENGQWLGDVEYGNGRFVATGGYGYSAWSIDGIVWQEGGSLGTEASRSLAFGNGEFRTQTDPGNWYRSTDGESWTLHSSGHSERIAFCAGSFKDAPDCGPAFGHGVYVRGGGWNSGSIEWSEDAQNWTSVTVGHVGAVNGFAFGYAP
jgi:hypothetical protein